MSSSKNYRYCPLSLYNPLMRRAFDHHFKDEEKKNGRKGDLVKSVEKKWPGTALDYLTPKILDPENALATVQPHE